MVRIDFDGFIKDASAFFERTKPPAQKTMELWFEEVRHIHSSHIRFITAEMKLLDTWPRNITTFMRSKSSEISEKEKMGVSAIHPRRLRPHEHAKADCEKCAGTGLYKKSMTWPVRRDASGVVITRQIAPKVLCQCTDAAEHCF
jgi:hypothetical protein